VTTRLPRCKCRRKAVTVAPGSAAVYAPGGIVIDRGKPAEAWCAACAAARGWLVAPVRPKVAPACSTPRSTRKTAPAGRSQKVMSC
jgi:acetyl esterase/lipase